MVLQVRDNGFKGDTRVVLNILNSPSLTLSVPAELEVQDSAFIQYVAQEALAHYKQSKVSIKSAARQNVHAMITVPRQFLIIEMSHTVCYRPKLVIHDKSNGLYPALFLILSQI